MRQTLIISIAVNVSASAVGLVLWDVFATAAGSRKGWDHAAYFSVGLPLMLLLSGALGAIEAHRGRSLLIGPALVIPKIVYVFVYARSWKYPVFDIAVFLASMGYLAMMGLCSGAACLGAFMARASGRRPPSDVHAGHCSTCGYSKQGLPKNAPCPECGGHTSNGHDRSTT